MYTYLFCFCNYNPRFEEEGVYWFSSVRPSFRPSFRTSFCPSVTNIFRRTFLSNHVSQPLQTWSSALARVSYTSLTEFTSASYPLSVLRLSSFFDLTWSCAKFSSHFPQQPRITANSFLVWCFCKGSYKSLTEFTSASYPLPVLRHSLFS